MLESTYSISEPEKIQLAGPGEARFIQIENKYGVRLITRPEGKILLQSEGKRGLASAEKALNILYSALKSGRSLDDKLLNEVLETPNGEFRGSEKEVLQNYSHHPILLDRLGKPVIPRTLGQAHLVSSMEINDITLVDGPAGTGKTFLAVAMAVAYFQRKLVQKIVLVRPAVESGESLGYLPGDLKEKVAPYMAPLFDALNILLPPEQLKEHKESGEIEVIPLAYMRGRTLNNSFMVLDEAQNTTISQMKMFLTRFGLDSKIVVAGDDSQKDLPVRRTSGLSHSFKILKSIQGVGHLRLGLGDVVRHHLVKEVIKAYESSVS